MQCAIAVCNERCCRKLSSDSNRWLCNGHMRRHRASLHCLLHFLSKEFGFSPPTRWVFFAFFNFSPFYCARGGTGKLRSARSARTSQASSHSSGSRMMKVCSRMRAWCAAMAAVRPGGLGGSDRCLQADQQVGHGAQQARLAAEVLLDEGVEIVAHRVAVGVDPGQGRAAGGARIGGQDTPSASDGPHCAALRIT